jgi:hypothetical protein
MSTAPVITIFVRHGADCKYYGEEFYRKCNCRKHPVGPPQIPKLLGRNKQFRLKSGHPIMVRCRRTEAQEAQFEGKQAPGAIRLSFKPP